MPPSPQASGAGSQGRGWGLAPAGYKVATFWPRNRDDELAVTFLRNLCLPPAAASLLNGPPATAARPPGAQVAAPRRPGPRHGTRAHQRPLHPGASTLFPVGRGVPRARARTPGFPPGLPPCPPPWKGLPGSGSPAARARTPRVRAPPGRAQGQAGTRARRCPPARRPRHGHGPGGGWVGTPGRGGRCQAAGGQCPASRPLPPCSPRPSRRPGSRARARRGRGRRGRRGRGRGRGTWSMGSRTASLRGCSRVEPVVLVEAMPARPCPPRSAARALPGDAEDGDAAGEPAPWPPAVGAARGGAGEGPGAATGWALPPAPSPRPGPPPAPPRPAPAPPSARARPAPDSPPRPAPPPHLARPRARQPRGPIGAQRPDSGGQSEGAGPPRSLPPARAEGQGAAELGGGAALGGRGPGGVRAALPPPPPRVSSPRARATLASPGGTGTTKGAGGRQTKGRRAGRRGQLWGRRASLGPGGGPDHKAAAIRSPFVCGTRCTAPAGGSSAACAFRSPSRAPASRGERLRGAQPPAPGGDPRPHGETLCLRIRSPPAPTQVLRGAVCAHPCLRGAVCPLSDPPAQTPPAESLAEAGVRCSPGGGSWGRGGGGPQVSSLSSG